MGTRDRLSGKWKVGQLQIEKLHKLLNWDYIVYGFKLRNLKYVRYVANTRDTRREEEP
jgi:hypothetical protein